MENKPVKCPDCGTWWRGMEHTCPNPTHPKQSRFRTKGEDSPHIDQEPKGPKGPPEKVGCPLCGSTQVHYCPGRREDNPYSEIRKIKPRLFNWDNKYDDKEI